MNSAPRYPKDKNPAEYMLEVIGAGDLGKVERNWGDIWANYEEHGEWASEIEQLIKERRPKDSTSAGSNREFAMPWATQIFAVVRRTFISYWRTPEYVIGKFALNIFTGVFNAFTLYKLGDPSIDMQSRLFSIFMVPTISPPLIQQLQPKFLHFRSLFKVRENSSKIYRWSAFVVASILVEVPYSIVAGTLYFVSWYFPIAFPRDRVGDAYAVSFAERTLSAREMVDQHHRFELYFVGFGQAIASFSPNELLASLLVVLSYRTHLLALRIPFTYPLEGPLGVLTRDVPLKKTLQGFRNRRDKLASNILAHPFDSPVGMCSGLEASADFANIRVEMGS